MTPTEFFNDAIEAGAVPAGCKLSSAYSLGAPAQSDTLARLVATGEKTATSSRFSGYLQDHDPLPAEGAYDVVVDSHGTPVALTLTTRVEIVPFMAVSAEHAAREGEQPKTLAAWRTVHEAFFAAEAAEAGGHFDPASDNVVLETFKVVYPL
ncbi:ASCH domain-containing protein [Lacticaseibacillus yichunensis]|uniref:ASCH domain-containing protein n=1 Tax=Lacticaseibacillus yichunensis TaxID=2486015 RepID=A0ABW4CQ45_9LACO|nr:ASCH domain-containing protein [Lacticaseibacillus yichunensis]